MAAYDWVGASSARVERANGSPAETIAADGRLLSWLAGMLAQDRHYHTVMATLTASENYPSTIVRAAAAFVGGEHYFFDAPAPGHCGEWSFPAVWHVARRPDEVPRPDEAIVRRRHRRLATERWIDVRAGGRDGCLQGGRRVR